MILIVLLLLALVVFLSFPFDGLPIQAWVIAWQTQLRIGLAQATPSLIVGLLGAIVGLAEITATFTNYPREALRARWSQFLILVNVAAAMLAFWIARTYAPTADLILTIIGVGIGFQALIRTRFIIAKQIGGNGGGDISLNLGWLYDQFQNLCKNQIDLELMNGRRTAVTKLLQRFPTLAELYDIASYTILARATLTAEEEKERLAELDRLFDPKAPANFARASIALMILENGGQAYVDLLLSQPEAATRATTPEGLAKQLVDKYSLEQLVALAKQCLASHDEKTWVEKAAEPAPGATEASQKAAIAYFLVQRAGVEVVQREIG